MKHIKSYKLFESKEDQHILTWKIIDKLISYYSNQKYNTEAECNSVNHEGYFEYVFPYLDGTIKICKQYLKDERDNHGNHLEEFKLYIFSSSVSKENSYYEDSNRIDEYEKKYYMFKTNLNKLYKVLDKIHWYTTYLCIAILRCIFSEESNNGPFDGVSLDEIQSRLSEFDVLKGNDIDYISLENLFEYYDKNKFDRKRFDKTLAYQLSRYN